MFSTQTFYVLTRKLLDCEKARRPFVEIRSARLINEMEKVCCVCKQTKPLDDYYRNESTGRVYDDCKACRKVRTELDALRRKAMERIKYYEN